MAGKPGDLFAGVEEHQVAGLQLVDRDGLAGGPLRLGGAGQRDPGGPVGLQGQPGAVVAVRAGAAS
jgi:hypothetical protein